jgi:2-polyprenyl-3-methyl-5-hydroxy-6-metoxy-1,4-benzoquinol methylase
MLLRSQKLQYLLESAQRYYEPVECPYCSSANASLIDRKYFFTRLYDCDKCHLYFRHPVERLAKNEAFYQNEYVEGDQITTTLPTNEVLSTLQKEGFSYGNKNADRYKKIFESLFPNNDSLRIVDYGCSWGYISSQLIKYGYDVESYEISKPRAAYGNQNLGLNILTNEEDIRSENDIFFSSHVIEHHPSISDMLKLAKRKLKKSGYFIAISPNGSKQYRQKDPEGFHRAWGKVHPNYLNADFYQTIFKDVPFYIGSSPFNYGAIRSFNLNDQVVDDLASEELIVIAKLL